MSNLERLTGRDIACVGFADWESELWTNQHHLMDAAIAKLTNSTGGVQPAAQPRRRLHQ